MDLAVPYRHLWGYRAGQATLSGEMQGEEMGVDRTRTGGVGRSIDRMDRRVVLAMLGAGAACALTPAATAQALPVIGYLAPEAPGPFASRIRAFHEGLAETGYVEGRNVVDRLSLGERPTTINCQRSPPNSPVVNVDVLVAPGGAPGGARREGGDRRRSPSCSRWAGTRSRWASSTA